LIRAYLRIVYILPCILFYVCYRTSLQGAAAIACIEFNDNPKIEASCIGFGCPALLDEKQSEKWKDKILTVIDDADCVPRMSGAAGTL
jgi:hypothetical protein